MKKQIILMVDDAASSLQIYGKILSDLPNTLAIGLTSSAAALDWCANNDPDLVLVDYHMPAPDGLAFIEQFRSMGKDRAIPAVMITSAEETSVRHRALELGADDFLQKPIDPIEFKMRAKNLLSLREGRRLLGDRAALLAREVQRATTEIRIREEETIFRLTRAAETRDSGSPNHIVRIGYLAGAIAERLGLPAAERELLSLAAPMHDIGKVAIPDHILLKPGRLTKSEWRIMRGHAMAGYDILRDSKSPLLRLGAEIALSHHEKFDGTGYPFAFKGEMIPISGRITAICDVFDALLSKRPYKAAWSLDRVLKHIDKQSGIHFDPVIHAAFRLCLPQLIEIRRQYRDELSAA